MINPPTRHSAAAARLFRRALTVAFLIASFATPAAAQEPHVVSGTVRMADGRPLAGATIRASGATGAARGTTLRTQSDAGGNYRLEVPPGDYDVDAFYDLEFDGQTYRELWLERSNEGCERQLSENGIVRHFELKLWGPLRCTANFDPNLPTSYAGAMLQIAPGNLPADAQVRFTLTPLGPLADGSAGWVLVYERTGSMLAGTFGPLGETAWLHDIPLGRYHVSAEAILPGEAARPLVLQSAAGATGTSIEIGFPAVKMFPYGMQSVIVRIVDGPVAPSQQVLPEAPGVEPGYGDVRAQSGGGLPLGRYDCSYNSEYVGEIPNGRMIEVLDDGRYQAWGGSGNYARHGSGIDWLSGPLAQGGVSVAFDEEGGRAVLTVQGGAAAEDPGGANRCVRSGG